MIIFIYGISQNGTTFLLETLPKKEEMYHSFIHGTQLGAPTVSLGYILTPQIPNKTILTRIRPATPRLLCECGNFYKKIQETLTKLAPTENALTLGTLLMVLVVVLVYVKIPYALSRAAAIIIIAVVRDLGAVFSEKLLDFGTVAEMFLSKLVNFEDGSILGGLKLALIVVFIYKPTRQTPNKTLSTTIRVFGAQLLNTWVKIFYGSLIKTVPAEKISRLGILLWALTVVVIHIITPQSLNRAARFGIIHISQDLGKVFLEKIGEFGTIGCFHLH